MRIATSTRVTCGIVLGGLVGAGVWLAKRSPSPPELPITSFAPPPAALDLELEPSSSSVQKESPSPPSPPFYASLFVAGATWTLPCTFGFERKASDAERCHVDEPTDFEPMRASAIVRHDGAWCSVYEMAGIDTSFGYTECISSRGIAGFGDHRDFTRHRCGDAP